VITPQSRPADGPQHIDWNFGTVTVSTDSTAAERTITIPYVTQVQNIAANANSSTLVNSSSYSYTGSLPVNSSGITVTVVEPSATQTLALSTSTQNLTPAV
jgi:hypothetical protein